MVMRRRFGRRRRTEEGGRSIDESWLGRAAQALPVETLARVPDTEVPGSLALVATGSDAEAGNWLVAISPTSAIDAVIGAIVAHSRHEGELSNVAAASPHWDAASHRLLASVMGFGRPIQPVVLAGEAASVAEVAPLAVTPMRLADQLGDPAARSAFQAAVQALAALAAKHDGGLRTRGASLELVISGAPMAELRVDADRAILETLLPSRNASTLVDVRLGEVIDRLEGQVRKRANDRKVRDGEEGLRGRLAAGLAAHSGVHSLRLWPASGAGSEAVDAVGVGADGVPVLLGGREKVGLVALAEILRGAQAIGPLLAALTEAAPPPIRLSVRPRIQLAGLEVAPAVRAALQHLTVPVQLFEARAGDGPFSAVDLGAPAPAAASAPVARPAAPAQEERRPAPAERAESAPDRGRASSPEREASSEAAVEQANGDEERPRRRRRRRGGNRNREAGEADETPEGGAAAASAAAETEAPARPAFEEMSMFDLDDGDEPDPGPRRRRRRRGGQADEEETVSDASESESSDREERARRKGRGGRGRRPDHDASDAADSASEDEDDADELLELSPDAPDLELTELPSYEEEEGDEPESEADRIRLERERRRRARVSSAPAITVSESGERAASSTEQEDRALPKGRAAILAHADRESITAAVLLAREIRQIEGIWVYPQEDLMTFFRGVATDLRENTPIYVIGFAAKPARDALQAASLYRGRLVWFDHHDWPPEDLGELKSLLGESYAQVRPGGHSSLPNVLVQCTRRSRFSDKLVDLVTGRFTQHDFQRWGRVWWWRLGELTTKTGEHRGNLEMLLAGRPSDLAKEAARSVAPPSPPELEWVSGRDFRLVHFGGMAMVAGDVPEGLDLHMAMRIARERYGVALSFARMENDDVFILGADDVTGKRAVDVGGMVEHLAEKFGWIDALPDEDHVARLRARGADVNPDRVEELIAEIGMGRTILEG